MNSDESFLKKLDTDLATGNVVTDDHRGILHREKVPPIPDHWEMPEPDQDRDTQLALRRARQKSWFKRMFIASCVFLVIAAGVFGYSLYTGKARLTGDLVDVAVSTSLFADSGEEVSVNVTVTNRNTVPMELAKLVITYPLGTAKDPGAKKEIVKQIGSLGPGELFTETIKVQVFGEQGVEKLFSAQVEYRLGDAQAIFENTGETRLTLRSGTATLTIRADETVVSGQEFPVEITLTGNSTQPVQDTLLSATYPDGCRMVRSDPVPTTDSNYWYVGNLLPGTPVVVQLTMQCTTLLNSGQTITVVAGSKDPGNDRLITTVYTSTAHVITTSQPFLTTRLGINGKPYTDGIAIAQNRSSDIQIEYENTTDTPITNAQIKLALSGDAYDPDAVYASSGYFNSADNTVTWTGNELEELKTLDPGEKGLLTVGIDPKKGLQASATVDVAVSVSGVLSGGEPRELVNATTGKIAIGTNFDLIPKTLYHSGLLKNTGPIPMESGKETTYTIVWQLSNQPNPVSDAIVSTTLPTGIVWKGIVAPADLKPSLTYNTVTRQVTWKAGDVPALADAKTVAFTVGITPSKSQIGTVPNLTSNITFSGFDTVTKTEITGEKRFMTTRIPNDTSKIGSDGKVVK